MHSRLVDDILRLLTNGFFILVSIYLLVSVCVFMRSYVHNAVSYFSFVVVVICHWLPLDTWNYEYVWLSWKIHVHLVVFISVDLAPPPPSLILDYHLHLVVFISVSWLAPPSSLSDTILYRERTLWNICIHFPSDCHLWCLYNALEHFYILLLSMIVGVLQRLLFPLLWS